MRVRVNGSLLPGVTSKDVVLHVIGQIGTAGGTGSVIEFCGQAFEEMSMEARMSVCNMSIEGGARAGENACFVLVTSLPIRITHRHGRS